MDKPLSPETQSQIRALCESIARRDQLGEDVQEELRGHIEDKVLGYLDGKEALTEEDALLLAREHFGNPASVRSLLFDAHPATRWRPWLRATAELVMIALVTDTVIRAGHVAAVIFAAHALEIHALIPALRWIDNAKALFGPVILLCALLAALRTRLRPGKVSALDHLTCQRLILLFLTAIVLWVFVPEVGYRGKMISQPGLREWAISGVSMLTAFAICTTWIALTARESSTWRVLALTAFSWALFTWAMKSRFYWPSAYLEIAYDPSRKDWVPLGPSVFDYVMYKFEAAKFIASSERTRFLITTLLTLQSSLANAAVGLLCYLGLSQLGVPGFKREYTRDETIQTVR
jgi:hypothetical protein